MFKQAVKQYAINNFICKFGQKKNGVQYGGDAILNSTSVLKSRKVQSTSLINTITIKKHADYRDGYKIVHESIRQGLFNINLGGDHSISASTVQPMLDHYKDDILVIWIDAHADINTFEASHTKNLHGMPLASLTGLMNHWYQVKKNRFILPFKNLLYVGIRDLDEFEDALIHKKEIVHYNVFDHQVIQKIKEHPAKYIHISCDIDSMDPTFAPSTGTAVPNGLRVKNINKIIKASKDRLVGFDLVEFNPLIGNKRDVKQTLLHINKILNSLIMKK